MRIDKYLWCVRYYKTRSIATEAIKKGHIKINGQQAKPSKDVIIGDKLSIKKDQVEYTLLVISIPQNRVGAALVDLYRTDTTPKETFEQLELLKLSKTHYREYGEGRPTKKDRREITVYIETEKFFTFNDQEEYE